MKSLIVSFLSAAIVCLTAADVRWAHLSSAAGDLPVPYADPEPTASLVLDVDRDGTGDIIVGARKAGPSVVWYRRHASGWERYIIDDSSQRIEAGGAFHDIDGDGDLDIAFGADAGDNKIWWWENPHPNFDPGRNWVRREIKNSGDSKHHDQIFGDFDGDGRVELVSWNQRAKMLLLFEIPADPKVQEPWSSTAIYTWLEAAEHEGLAAADINRDGKMDIVGGGRWFERLEGTTFKAHVIDDAYRFSRVVTGDFHKGGRPEVVFGPGDNILPLKIVEWKGGSWTARELLPYDVNHGHSLAAGDIDRDGNLDVLCAEMGQWGRQPDNPHARMYVFYGDGKGSFRAQIVQQGQGTHESRLGDLDGDGDLDVLGKALRHNCPRLDIWRNDGPGKPAYR